MRLFAAALIIFASVSAGAAGETKLGRFLKSCAWGTAIGAGAGAVSLVFEDKPTEHSVNIARGASLGLYGGIVFGLVEAEKENRPSAKPDPDEAFGLRPTFDGGRVSGVQALAVFRW